MFKLKKANGDIDVGELERKTGYSNRWIRQRLSNMKARYYTNKTRIKFGNFSGLS